MAAAGVRRGSRVLILLPDSVVAVVAILGVIRCGGVAVPLNPRLKPGDYERIIDDCRPDAAILAGDLAGLVAHLRPYIGDRCWFDPAGDGGRHLVREFGRSGGGSGAHRPGRDRPHAVHLWKHR